ncbi:hypothetical protein GCM10011578_020210 [Streptomyces fuscichromogenes]|uniref:Uncharacterized protein n=1 Tax=Streptomyces fuscichromogenes TaxID=1324013 RepID=A0A918CP33_9ACTN|nr:hypothetical protein GCM10011578_020210 [Streptomyces fuscichromogenes]
MKLRYKPRTSGYSMKTLYTAIAGSRKAAMVARRRWNTGIDPPWPGTAVWAGLPRRAGKRAAPAPRRSRDGTGRPVYLAEAAVWMSFRVCASEAWPSR